ncbi:Cystathionine beta-lyase family protein involved in aluminum resistance [Thermanaeromonas toyohensis ToBE]|uniref:Cystathionine beta-lyase family protein involved in aluminum resistance n=1 Tax=Thermanaeromonas toyohensis ToBE TaxID=698762 RepID=A0A1W1VXK4_9FIRM|nr:methionine gamma-lyase family protein [Thermanaeromonas toyohensis]SMB97614.1 Cystathionine beta-lyase family protein involved in aluminum resistance [Thermanaeromonas toyohensis ToBE]
MKGREHILAYFTVEPWLVEEMFKAEREARERGLFRRIEEISALNHYRVLKAFQEVGISDFHFQDSTGYGYGDLGRDVLEKLFAIIFQGEEALVRPQIVSGTHALSLCLHALLRPGDTLLAACGRPYDTLATVIGLNRPVRGSLVDRGVRYAEVQLTPEGQPDLETLAQQVERLKPRICFIQRSRGYYNRPALGVNTIRQVIRVIKEAYPRTLCLVDNCYGELVEVEEPCAAGADLVAGSLIKNPGGTLAPGGGYIVGRKELVEEVSYYLTAPGLGREIGAFSGKRLFFQGLFLAPLAVEQALKGAVLAALFFQRLGYPVDPLPEEERHDIVQAITLGNEQALLAFCRGLQKGSPVETYNIPEPALLPGYEDPIIMAGGTFIQGASLELSADAPLRPPYTVFLQGGISLPYTKIGLLLAAQEVTHL